MACGSDVYCPGTAGLNEWPVHPPKLLSHPGGDALFYLVSTEVIAVRDISCGTQSWQGDPKWDVRVGTVFVDDGYEVS